MMKLKIKMMMMMMPTPSGRAPPVVHPENNISHVAPAALSGLPRLETLDLGSNTLGDESLGPDALTVRPSPATLLCLFH